MSGQRGLWTPPGLSLGNGAQGARLGDYRRSARGTAVEEKPIFTFTSHIEGKNAKVSVYSDRIEWLQPRAVSNAKLTAGFFTVGLSLLATGVKHGKTGTEMIPVKSISSVTTSRDGIINSKVSVITSGNTIDFRVSHSEAAEIKKVLTQLIMGTHPSQNTAEQPAPPAMVDQPAADPGTAVPQHDVMVQLTKLSELRAAGILTDEEFNEKKAELLRRL
jgi:hypothetical protein